LGAVTGLFAGAALTTGLTAGGDGLGGAGLAGAVLTGGFGRTFFVAFFTGTGLAAGFLTTFLGAGLAFGSGFFEGAGLPCFFGAGLEAGFLAGADFLGLLGATGMAFPWAAFFLMLLDLLTV
jgi:hypothetical protein